MKFSGLLLGITMATMVLIASCAKTNTNNTPSISGSMTGNIGSYASFSGINCVATAYNSAVVISGGSFTGTNTAGVFPIVTITLMGYQSTAPYTYAIDSFNNTMLYETMTDTFYTYKGSVTISTLVPNITGSYSCSMTNMSKKDTAMASGSFSTLGL